MAANHVAGRLLAERVRRYESALTIARTDAAESRRHADRLDGHARELESGIRDLRAALEMLTGDPLWQPPVEPDQAVQRPDGAVEP